MTISLPIKVFLGGLAIIVSLASAAQAGRPEIHNIDVCKAVAKYYGKSWGGSGNYSKTSSTYGCYYYENGKLNWKENFINGLIDGESLIYYETGQLWYKTNFKQMKQNVNDYNKMLLDININQNQMDLITNTKNLIETSSDIYKKLKL